MRTKIAFKRLEKQINKIAKVYFDCMSILNKEKSIFKEKLTINQIITAYGVLSYEERKIINNEFFHQDYPNWWKSKYSYDDFTMQKYFAMTHFLEAYKNEH